MPAGAVVVEETEALLGYGLSPLEVADVLHMKVDSLAKALGRHERLDLVAAVREAEKADRKRLAQAKGTWQDRE